MKRQIRRGRSVVFGFCFALMVLGLSGWISYQSTVRFARSAEVVSHTHRILATLEELLHDTTSAESQVRGYVITGDEHFLEIYASDSAEVVEHLSVLEALVGQSAVRARLDELAWLTRARLERLTLTAELRRSQGFDAARDASGPGKRLMEKVRRVAEGIAAIENARLAERDLEAHALARRSKAAVILGSVLALLVAAASGGVFLREKTQRERLEREVLEISEREQRRIGQDLHDGVCQHLTGTSLLSQSLQQTLSGPSAVAAAQITQLINEGIGQARRVTRGLHPVPDEPVGLMLALQDLVDQVRVTSSLECHFDCPAPVPLPDQNVATHLYRIAQEAVQNVLRHAQARSVRVGLSMDEMALRLTVSDDGRGMGAPGSTRGMGLEIMTYRAQTIGAQLCVEPESGSGTRITCTFARSLLI